MELQINTLNYKIAVHAISLIDKHSEEVGMAVRTSRRECEYSKRMSIVMYDEQHWLLLTPILQHDGKSHLIRDSGFTIRVQTLGCNGARSSRRGHASSVACCSLIRVI